MVRSHSKPLEQVINRYNELSLFCDFDTNKLISTNPKLKKSHNDRPLIENCSSPQFKLYSNQSFSINVKSVSYCYIGGLNGQELMKVYNICYDYITNKHMFVCRTFNTIKSFYSRPIDSLILEIG